MCFRDAGLIENDFMCWSTGPHTVALAVESLPHLEDNLISQTQTVARLVHLSDIHFGHKKSNNLWESLQDCVLNLKPAAVLVTGDIVNTPWKKQFDAATQALAGLRPLKVLVCPGNHDRHFFGNALFGQQSPFGREFYYYLNDFYVQAPKVDLIGLGPRVKAIVTAVDSSDRTSYFARSFVAPGTRDAISAAFQKVPEGVEPNHLVLRIVLFHHHLLPIPALEADADHLWGPFSSATTQATNAGTVLDTLVRAEVDLVLHGHEHQRNIARYTSLAGKRWPVTVVGAGSTTGTDTKLGWSADRASFNVLEVRDDDSIWISEYASNDRNQWSSRNVQPLILGVDLRRSRYARRSTVQSTDVATLKTHYGYSSNGDISVHRVFSAEHLPDDAICRFHVYSETGQPEEPEVWIQDSVGRRQFGRIEKGFTSVPEKLRSFECATAFPVETAATDQIVGCRYRWIGAGILRMKQILDIPEPGRSYLHSKGLENVYSKAPKSPLLRSLEVSVELPREWAPDDTQDNFAAYVKGPGDAFPRESPLLSNRIYYNGDGLFALRIEYPDSETNYYICWRPRDEVR